MKNKSLKVYWTEKMYGQTKTAILCHKHKQSLFRVEPSAHGYGEWFPESECERCNLENEETKP